MYHLRKGTVIIKEIVESSQNVQVVWISSNNNNNNIYGGLINPIKQLYVCQNCAWDLSFPIHKKPKLSHKKCKI